MKKITNEAREVINALGTSIEVPPGRYDSAEKSYKSLAEWFSRPESTLSKFDINVYLQGSFRLGTAIRPINGDEHYDLDMVCEIKADKNAMTQAELQQLLGIELKSYADRFGMEKPEQWDRCWTLNYTESARFHMDILPGVPDGQEQSRRILAMRFDQTPYFEKAIGITDKKHHNFRTRSTEWPTSNPNGYADWFYSRMNSFSAKLFQERELAKGKVEVADVPKFKRDTPLQIVIKLLKRHRDIRFAEDPDYKPTSIVLTTLAARSYQGQTDITEALFDILNRMHLFIEAKDGQPWISNPSDPRENFADAWASESKLSEAFNDWLESAKTDFTNALQAEKLEDIIETLAPRLGRKFLSEAAGKVKFSKSGSVAPNALSLVPEVIVDAPHRRPPKWPVNLTHQVHIKSAVFERKGFRPAQFKSAEEIPNDCGLVFEAKTDVPRGYRVFWQVVNTGPVAKSYRNLRGTFDEVEITEGTLVKKERSQYEGIHSIECFIVKDGICVARSSPYVVMIS